MGRIKKITLLIMLGGYMQGFSQNTESIALSYSSLPTQLTLNPTLFWYSDDLNDPFMSGFRLIGSWDDVAPNPIKFFLAATGIKKIETSHIPVLDWQGLEKIGFKTYNLSYQHRFRNNLALGANFIYGRAEAHSNSPDLNFDKCNSTIMSLAIDFTKIYGKKNYYLYNTLVFYPFIIENTEFKRSYELIAKHSLVLYAYELRIIGINAKIAGSSDYCYDTNQRGGIRYFFDIGFGYMGLLRSGLSYDF
jgi:hypothetical protein